MSALKEPISLEKTIENFHDFILDKSQRIEQQIIGPDHEFKQERLSVYYEGYSLRLMEILEKTFIGLRGMLGEKFFDKLGRDYIKSYPSNHFSVRYFGRHFSKFLASRADIEPIYVEIAAFEWSLEHVIDAKDAPQITFDDLATLSPESWANLVLTTHPSLIIVPFFYPTPSLWQAIRHDKERPAITPQEQATHWLMWRFNRQALFAPTTPEQLAMMHAIRRGETFSEVCEGLCGLLDEEKVVNFAAQTLRQWIDEGIFSEFKA